MKRGWFGPKLIGWGVSPASWEGWAATAAFVLAMLLIGASLEAPWIWGGMGLALIVYLGVVILTYDKNARTFV
jgi:hypothetical protein